MVRDAANCGVTVARANVVSHGIGCERNHLGGLALLKAYVKKVGVNDADSWALHRLARAHTCGCCLRKNSRLAQRYLTVGADKGCTLCLLDLSVAYRPAEITSYYVAPMELSGITPNAAACLSLLQAAAEHGTAGARVELGM